MLPEARRDRERLLSLPLFVILAVLCVAILFAIRPRQKMVRSRVYRVYPDELWQLMRMRRGEPDWTGVIQSVEWENGSDTDGMITYKGGSKAYMRQRIDDANMHVATSLDVMNSGNEPGERMISLTSVTADPGGSRCTMSITSEKIGPLGVEGWLGRLTRPLVGFYLSALVTAEIERNGALARYAADNGNAPEAVSFLGMRMSWLALGLAAVALGYWGWSFGLWFTVALAAGLVLHEAGHVAVMRAFGDRASAFYFVPFLGGVAIGQKKHESDSQLVAMVIGGPAAGLLSAIAAGVLGWWFDNDFLLACGHFFAIFNLFNLLPIPPLDGGQIALAMARPFVSVASLIWVRIVLTAIGAAGAVWLGEPVLVVMFALLLVFAIAFRAVPPDTSQKPLSGRGAAGTLLTTVVIIVGLCGIIGIIGDEMTLRQAFRALIRGPFA